jgi:tripartite-type tricarboxylate transporter receptor subunit TctC
LTRIGLILALAWAMPVCAQSFPARTIRMVVPLAAAGAGDIVGRTVTTKLAEMWGQQIVIDNRPGANTIIGTDLVAKAKPDGYTWLLGVQGSLAINPASYPKLPYDAEKDFDPVTQLTLYGYVLVVHPALPARTVNELIALARARPGQLAYGTSGNGGSNHLAGESFRLATGVRMDAIPYKGSAPALTALLSGDVPVMFDTLITSIPLIKAGRLRALGVTLPRRSAALPDVPTVAEAGVRGYEFTAWQSIVVPAGTDKAIIGKIQADVVKVLAMPDVRRKLIDEGANELVGSAPEALGRLIHVDIQKYRRLIADAHIRIE